MKNVLKPLALVVAVAMCACLLVGCSSGAVGSSSSSVTGSVANKATGEYGSGKHHALVKVEGFDPFTIELDADSAPVTVSNFCNLANDGYYDGLRFYRIVEGFCLQGGTKGDSASGNDPSLPPIIGEFDDNGVENPLADDFGRGSVAMARTNKYDSAKSTFFITLSSSQNVALSLNGQYAAFGKVDDAGMDVVDAIVARYLKYATGQAGAIDDPADMPVIESITIED